MNKYSWIADEFIDSKDMREYLSDENNDMSVWFWYKFINSAPRAIENKIVAFERVLDILSTEDDEDEHSHDDYIKNTISLYKYAISELDKPGIYSITYSETNHSGTGIDAIADSFDGIKSLMKNNDTMYEPTDTIRPYYEIKKWLPDENGISTKSISYIINNDEIWYISTDDSVVYSFSDWIVGDLSAPSPFKRGDILKVKGYGFSDDNTILILFSRPYYDCCSPQGLSIDENGRYNTGAICHYQIGYSDTYPKVPYLFSAEKIDDIDGADIDETILKIYNIIKNKSDKEAEDIEWCIYNAEGDWSDNVQNRLSGVSREAIDKMIELNFNKSAIDNLFRNKS